MSSVIELIVLDVVKLEEVVCRERVKSVSFSLSGCITQGLLVRIWFSEGFEIPSGLVCSFSVS